MTARGRRAVGDELGLDASASRARRPTSETERHIRERRERGLFAGMRFTMAQPEESCHPETLLPGARTRRLRGALLLGAGAEPLAPGQGRLPRYTWDDAYAELRERLDVLGRAARRRLPRARRREPARRPRGAARSGVGFYGKNTMLITRRHGSWVVLGTLVTDVELEPTPPLDADCGACRLCIDACPTGALDEPGTLDATKCLSYWTQAPAADPGGRTAPTLGAQVYGCDICQDVCPWNRGVEKRRAGEPPRRGEPHVDLVDWLEADGEALVDALRRASTCRATIRAGCSRNALVALGNTGGPEHAPLLARVRRRRRPAARRARAWALARIETRA